jgi:hypothetical protein
MQLPRSTFRRPGAAAHSATGGSQWPVITVLVLVIAGAVALSVHIWGGGKRDDRADAMLHMWCTEAKKEYTIDPETLPEDLRRRMFEMGDGALKLPNPDTGRPTLIEMWKCLKCRKPFAPESWKTGRPDPKGPTCPHCDTNMREFSGQGPPTP